MALARFYMFQQVYFHRTRRIYDLHLSRFLSDNLSGGCFPAAVSDFLKLDDVYFENALREQANCDSTNITVKALAERQHFKCVCETSDYPDDLEKEQFGETLKKLRSDFDGLLDDNVTNAPYKWNKGDFVFVKPKKGGTPIEIGRYGNLVKNLDPIQKSRIYSPRKIFDDVEKAFKSLTWNRGEDERDR
jgi:HD superfamily phosphohydrolase